MRRILPLLTLALLLALAAAPAAAVSPAVEPAPLHRAPGEAVDGSYVVVLAPDRDPAGVAPTTRVSPRRACTPAPSTPSRPS